MDVGAVQSQRQFHIHQRVTMMVNRYEIFADDGVGGPGAKVAFVEQKRMKFKEEVTLYTDESKQSVFAGFKARKVVDLASAYDVTGAGQPIGVFGKKFGKSLLRSTWTLDQPGLPALTVQERNAALAVFRRVWGLLPFIGDLPFIWKYHFDFVDTDGRNVGFFEKKTRFRDHYVLRIEDDRFDRRLMLAQAVALDALQSR
ncbi:hypothetical protein OG800_41230 [Streptomyces sp. NBC_00445]|uniref:hypothetical protein n=1 Tax=unclassified Streptomyces TaxID=2593676 RepID=UPI002E1EAA09|nr:MULTISPECIES: hypothetical protein [unclassified Streptomyces]